MNSAKDYFVWVIVHCKKHRRLETLFGEIFKNRLVSVCHLQCGTVCMQKIAS